MASVIAVFAGVYQDVYKEFTKEDDSPEWFKDGTTLPAFNLGRYCGWYLDPSEDAARDLYEFEAGDTEIADSLSAFLMNNDHRIVYLEMSLCLSNYALDSIDSELETIDLSIGFRGPILKIVDAESGDINTSYNSSGFMYIKGYFKVLGIHTGAQDARIIVILSPLPIEAVL